LLRLFYEGGHVILAFVRLLEHVGCVEMARVQVLLCLPQVALVKITDHQAKKPREVKHLVG
jgi:hypothetical protein